MGPQRGGQSEGGSLESDARVDDLTSLAGVGINRTLLCPGLSGSPNKSQCLIASGPLRPRGSNGRRMTPHGGPSTPWECDPWRRVTNGRRGRTRTDGVGWHPVRNKRGEEATPSTPGPSRPPSDSQFVVRSTTDPNREDGLWDHRTPPVGPLWDPTTHPPPTQELGPDGERGPE